MLHQLRKSGLLLGKLLRTLLKTRLTLMKNVLKPLAKSALILLGLTPGAPETDSVTTLIISNEEISDVMKIVKSFEESCL